MYGDRCEQKGQESGGTSVVRSGWVDGSCVRNIVLDTGAAKTIVKSNLVMAGHQCRNQVCAW